MPGIVRFSNSPSGFVRSANLSLPRFNNFGSSLGSGIQIFPAVSPTGGALAYFDISFPDSTFFTQPATARLIVANGDGSGAIERAVFAPGFFPLGLTWSADGTQLVFSIAPQQVQSGASQFFAALGNPDQAVVRVTPSFGADTSITSLPGINGGFLPNLPFTTFTTPAVDLSSIPLSLNSSAGGGLTLQASGLDATANYILESSSTAQGFGNPQTFSGQSLMNGVSITNQGRQFFRIRNP